MQTVWIRYISKKISAPLPVGFTWALFRYCELTLGRFLGLHTECFASHPLFFTRVLFRYYCEGRTIKKHIFMASNVSRSRCADRASLLYREINFLEMPSAF